MLSKSTLSIAAGVCGTMFIAYCVYFDKKRRNDPEFKKKLHERRRALKEARSGKVKRAGNVSMKDREAVQKYFLQEVQLGEEMLANGDIQTGVEHLANAISVCEQPVHLLQVLQQSLPPQVFHLLVQRLESGDDPLAALKKAHGDGMPSATVEELDL